MNTIEVNAGQFDKAVRWVAVAAPIVVRDGGMVAIVMPVHIERGR